MKADRARILTQAAKLDPGVRLVLLYGGDDSASRELADRFVRQFAGSDDPLAVETIAAADLVKDPARLAAAAAARSMFGDRTLVRVDGADNDTTDAVAAVLDGPAGNPVVVVAGDLKKGSKLVALAEAAAGALALASYPPQPKDAAVAVAEVAGDFHLNAGRGAARALFDACAGDRQLLRREVEKLGLYLDATAADAKTFELADLAAIGADFGDAELFEIGGAIAGGDPAAADAVLARLAKLGGIALLRATIRRFWQLLDLRAAVDGGASPDAAVKGARPPVFFKEQAAVAAELKVWRTPMLRAALARLLAEERAIKRSGSAGDVLALQALLGLAQQGRARR